MLATCEAPQTILQYGPGTTSLFLTLGNVYSSTQGPRRRIKGIVLHNVSRAQFLSLAKLGLQLWRKDVPLSHETMAKTRVDIKAG